MTEGPQPLSDDERAELEALRAEKAAREAREQAQRERAELEELRAAKAAAQGSAVSASGSQEKTPTPQQNTAAQAAPQRRVVKERPLTPHEQEVMERNRRFVEPDEDLKMPLAQKIVLIAILAFAVIALIVFILGPH